MPQAAQISPRPSPGATPRPHLAPPNVPANDSDMGEGPTPQPSPVTESGPAPKPRPKPDRLTNIDIGLMITTAVVFDLIGLIPVIGEITSTVLAALTFGLWFIIKGVPLISPKKVAAWGIPLIAEAIPALSEFTPGVTIGIVLVIVMTRFEDKTGLDVMSLAKGKVPDLAAVEKHLTEQMQSRAKGGGAAQTGARPTPPPQPQVAGGAAKDIHPVTASQQEHFADPSQPSAVAQGATPRTPGRPALVPRPKPSAGQDEEVATGLRGAQDTDSFSPDAYREDPYALDSATDQQRPANEPFGPRRVSPEMRPAPFPGTSPQFGRGSRYEERAAEAGEGGKLLDFDIRRRASPPDTKEDATPKGATPPSKAA